jgi:hypothetical protein
MGYRIMINEKMATIDDGVWQCSDIKIKRILNNWLEIRQLTASPDEQMFSLGSPSVPNPDYLIATEAVKDFEAKLLDKPIKPPPVVSEGKVIKNSDILY